MAGAVRFALRHSRLVIGGWIAVIVLCAGLGVVSGHAFTPTNLVISGTESDRWSELHEDADFGVGLNVLLTGPKQELRRQGRALTARLREDRAVRVVSPFDARPAGARRASGNQLTKLRENSALLTIDVLLRPGEPVEKAVPPVRAAIDDTVREPVSVRMTGAPTILEGLVKGSFTATRKAELIAVPLVLIVLLFVFQTPVAAALPGLLGFGTVLAGSGIVQAVARLTSMDQLSLSLASMMGLALGIDYALLLVSRYREHRRLDPEAVDANIEAAASAAGRTIATAAILLISVMVGAALLSIGPVLKSAAIAIVVVTVISSLSAILVAPPLLRIIDPWLERWPLPLRRSGRPSRLARRQPIVVPALALIGLLVLAAPSLGITPGAPDVRLLPKDAPARADFERISSIVGPGFASVFDLAIHSRDDRPVTTASSLRAIARLERQLARDPGVDAVFGPGQLTQMSEGVNDAERGFDAQEKGLARLDRGLSQAAGGSRAAGDGAAALQDATGEAHDGAEQLADGLRGATAGSRELIGGVGSANGGSQRLADGSERAEAGAGRLSEGLRQAKAKSGGVSNSARLLQSGLQTGSDQLAALDAPVDTVESRLATAWRAIDRMTTGRDDPQYAAARQALDEANKVLTGRDPQSGDQLDPSYAGVASGIADADGQVDLGLYLSRRLARDGDEAKRGIGRLAAGAARLDRGLGQLAAGSSQLSAGLARLSAEGGQLPPGLDQLADGAGLLAGGIGQLEQGSGRLATGIGGSGVPGQLTGALQRMASGVARQRQGSGTGQLLEMSPGFFESGVLPLALSDGAPRPTRDRTQLVLDMTNGGKTARMVVIPAYTSNDDRIGALHERIQRAADAAERPELEIAVGGPASSLEEFEALTADRLPLLIAAFALISFLVLVVALRAVPLAAICVALNVLTVGVTFGVMQLGFGGDDPLLGGPGYVDVISLSATLAVVFALSIDYQVFLLARIREEYLATGSNERALTAAIGSTAKVITGAAAIMVAAFMASGVSDLIAIREVGVGLSVAVLLDATVVRLVLLPAAMRLIGEDTWWLPAWLDRRLPSFSL